MIKRNCYLLTVLGFGLSTSAAMVHAQHVIEEVIVTAQKRTASLSETPIAISTFDNRALAEKGVTDLSGIAAHTPSITAIQYPSSNNTLAMFIRGQGAPNPMEVTQDGAVGLYLDGFYLARPQSSTFDIADVERVEILRGPQGTLYGRNTSGGAVNIITRRPSGEFGFKQELTFGSYDQFRSLTTIDLPEVADFSLKLSHLHSSKDGYVKNTGSSHDYNENEQQATRLSMAWRPDRPFTVDYTAEIGELNSTPVYYQNPALNGMTLASDGTTYFAKEHRMERTYRPIDLPVSTSKYQGHYLTLDWQISENLSLKSLTGYRDLEAYVYQDYAEIFYGPYASEDFLEAEQVSQEIQLIGDLLNGSLEYVAGVYYFRESAWHRVLNAGVLDRIVDAESESAAVYGQASWSPPVFDDRLTITLGGRYTRDQREAERDFLLSGTPIPQAVTRNDDSYQRFNPLIILEYDIADDINGYVKVSTGYRSGGSSEASELDGFGITFGPEDVTSYEAGLKSYWWNQRIRLNAAMFYTELDDMQLAFNPGSADPSFVTAYNAGNAVIKGIEVDLLFSPTENIALGVDYTYLDTDIRQVDVVPNTIFSSPGSQYRNDSNIASLFVVPLTPEHSVNISADYTFFRFASGTLKASLNYGWRDAIYVSSVSGSRIPNNDMWQLESRGLLDARITMNVDLPRGDRLWVSLWGKNITDADHKIYVSANGTPLTGFVNQGVAWNEPSTYGIDLTYEY